MNLVVVENLMVPMSIVSIAGADKFFSDHIVEVRNQYYDVDASDLNLPVKNRVGDLQIDRQGKTTVDPMSITCRADDGIVDCGMSKPAIDAVIASKHPKDFKKTEIVSENIFKQHVSSHMNVSIMINRNKLESIELAKPRSKMAIAYSYGCRECNQNSRVIISSNSLLQEGMIYFKSNCTLNQRYLSCNRKQQILK